jgi:ribosomal protein L15
MHKNFFCFRIFGQIQLKSVLLLIKTNGTFGFKNGSICNLMSLEEEIYKLQETREKALRAKDQLIEAQSEKIASLKKQREAFIIERDKGVKLLGRIDAESEINFTEGLNSAKSDAIERLQSKTQDLEYIIHKQDEMISNFESEIGKRSPMASSVHVHFYQFP